MLNSQVIFRSTKDPDDIDGILLCAIFWENVSFLPKVFEGEMTFRTKLTNFLQTFCEFMLHSEVIFKSLKGPEDNEIWYLTLCHFLELLDDSEVVGEIGGQDNVPHQIQDLLVLHARQVLKDVTALRVQNTHRLVEVMSLKDKEIHTMIYTSLKKSIKFRFSKLL